MPDIPIERIKRIKSFPSLVKFLRDELNWQLDANDIEDLTYDYDAEELGLSEDVATKIKEIKQLRPFSYDQPWGIFYIDFEPKRLPVVVLRRILQKLKIKKKTASGAPNMRHWELNDLMFISSYGPEDERATTFAHFSKESEDSPPVLRVITWDTKDAPLHLERCLTELSNLRYDPDTTVDQWREKWVQGFVLKHRHSITTSKALAKKLAELARDIRENCQDALNAEKESGPFRKTMKKFKDALIHDLTTDDFADMYAQTIAYGLLYTAIRSHVKGEGEAVSAERVQQLVLPTNPFLKEVMEDFFNIGSRKWDSEKEKLTGIEFDELGVNEIVATLKDPKTDFDSILRDFMNRNPNEDPVIHFYELFLKEYDSLKRKSRGVYYTPQPVVSFIVRSVHEVLQKDFGLEYGLADTTTWGQMIEKNPNIKIPNGVKEDDFFVQILDPALGTGTFLVETIDIIHKTMEQVWKEHGLDEGEINKHWKKYVSEKLLPRLYGFELMMAPYAIAHMKIGIKLYETGYRFGSTKRVQVYLTNTLEKPVNVSEYLDTLDPAMAEEAREANETKGLNSVTVVIGNPPYAGHSFNNNPWISNLLRTRLTDGANSYFEVDGHSLGERNPKWLNDDYVKFIRYSQYRLANTGTGIHGFITNHAYLDNPTFRGMRQSLLTSFQNVNIVDLHGNAKKKEKCPDGSKDENVFDIQLGVAVQVFSKQDTEKLCNLGHMWGTREQKFDTAINNDLYSLKSEQIMPVSDRYLFCPQDTDLQQEFENYVMISDGLQINSVGIVSSRDTLVFDFEEGVLKTRMVDFIDKTNSDKIAQQKYLSNKDKLVVPRARKQIQADQNWEDAFTKCLYRPFDVRPLFYHDAVIERGRREVMRHLLVETNFAITVGRAGQVVGQNEWDIVFCSQHITDLNLFRRGGNNLFPLYLYPDPTKPIGEGFVWPAGKNGRVPNLGLKFVNKLASEIELEFVSDDKGDLKKTFGPEDVFHYIYAIFYAPEYRSRYAEFLKRDFPRIPITSDSDLFKKLCGFGGELVLLHLMESDKLSNHITAFPVKGDNAVTKVGETGKKLKDVEGSKGKLFISKTQYFDNLPEKVWNFHIGGYQVCHKWLADRKKAGRKLSADDIEHYHKIVVALSETIKIMKEIDEVINAHDGWPIK